ncbi:MAG: hypothetical protein U0271_33110 [Polyangiaceae bacterium]
MVAPSKVLALLGRRRVLAGVALMSALSIVAPSTAWAQGAPPAGTTAPGQPAEDPIKAVARQRYQDGVKAYDAGKYEEARLAFEQAYTLTKVPAVLYNLGLSEVKSGHPVEGGNHLLQFLREHKDATPTQRTEATAAIEQCKKNAGLLTITVDQPGADVSIDGTVIAKSPLPDPVFVEPGARTVMAQIGARGNMARVDIKKGDQMPVSIVISIEGQNPQNPQNPTYPPYPQNPQNPQNPTYPPQNPQPYPSGPRREDFGKYLLHSPIPWVGAGLFAVSLGIGIGFTVAANNSKADSEQIVDDIRAQAHADGVDGAPCGAEDGGSAADVYPSACSALRDALSVHTANVAVAATFWVVAALAAGGTVTYVMLDWYPGKKRSSDDYAVHVAPVPLLGPDMQGAALVGTF